MPPRLGKKARGWLKRWLDPPQRPSRSHREPLPTPFLLHKIAYIPSMQSISISEARANMKALVDRVVADKAPIAITRQKGEGVVLISESEWASIEETLYLLQSPANARELLASIAELDAGKGSERDLIEP